MIRFATLHDTGKQRLPRGRGERGKTHRYILKYFDPWMPLADDQAEFKYSNVKPKIDAETCVIEEKDVTLFHEVPLRANVEMKTSVVSFMFDPREIYPWFDMCNDAGYIDTDVDLRKLVLFLFWHQKGILWDRRLFLQCNPPFIPRRTYRDETP